MSGLKKILLSMTGAAAVALIAACASSGPSMSSAEMAAASGQTTGVDMQGNVIELGEFFTYGGDNMGAYSNGTVGTGAKDPAVCGGFGGAKCSVGHLK